MYREVQGSADNAAYQKVYDLIAQVDKFGNDIDEVDRFARDVAYTYTKPLERYKNPRGGMFQAGLYPVSANVPLGRQTGATPDGRYAYTPVADGVVAGSRPRRTRADCGGELGRKARPLYPVERDAV